LLLFITLEPFSLPVFILLLEAMDLEFIELDNFCEVLLDSALLLLLPYLLLPVFFGAINSGFANIFKISSLHALISALWRVNSSFFNPYICFLSCSLSSMSARAFASWNSFIS